MVGSGCLFGWHSLYQNVCYSIVELLSNLTESNTNNNAKNKKNTNQCNAAWLTLRVIFLQVPTYALWRFLSWFESSARHSCPAVAAGTSPCNMVTCYTSRRSRILNIGFITQHQLVEDVIFPNLTAVFWCFSHLISVVCCSYPAEPEKKPLITIAHCIPRYTLTSARVIPW